MLLTAGSGSRLRPLTAHRAKPTLPLLGRPLIEYQMKMLAEWGVAQVVANLHHGQKQLRAILEGAARELDMEVVFSVEEQLMGTAGGLALARETLAEMHGDTFLLMNGDTLCRFDLDALVESFDSSSMETSVLLRERPAGIAYTSVHAENGIVLGIGEDGGSMGRHMFAGVWLAHERLLERLGDEPTGLEVELMPALVASRRMAASVQNCDWLTIDTPRRYLNASRAMLREEILRDWWSSESFALPANDMGRVAAGEHCRLADGASFTGEVIVGSSCRIDSGAEVHNSILWDGVHVKKGARVRNSILADGISVQNDAQVDDEILMRVDSSSARFRSAELVQGVVRAPIRR